MNQDVKPEVHEKPGANSLKHKGITGLIAASVVMAVLFLIILLSKLNEVRHNRVPVLWNAKLKKMAKQATKHLKEARDAKDETMAIHHAYQAKALFDSVHDLVGSASMAKICGIDIPGMEAAIEKALHEVAPHTAEEHDNNNTIPVAESTVAKSPSVSPVKSPIVETPIVEESKTRKREKKRQKRIRNYDW